MFQRFSFSPFSALSTLSTPQLRGSPRSFTSRLFARGRTSASNISASPCSAAERTDPGPDSNLETSRVSCKLDFTASVEEKDGQDSETEDNLKSTQTHSEGAQQDVEDITRDADLDSNNDNDLLYEAESPDEAALVHAARVYRCTLRGRSAESLLVDLPGIGSLAVQLLHILPFDSNRKRMSVVVRHPLTGQVVVYTKGADSVIMDLAEAPKGS